MTERLVIDTCVWVAALKSEGGASRQVLRLCLKKRCRPLMSESLFNELEAVMGRVELFKGCALNSQEQRNYWMRI